MTAEAGPVPDGGGVESVEDFRRRAREWITANLRTVTPAEARELYNYDNEDSVRRNRDLMAGLHAAGLMGICYPVEYGGQGLTPEHLRAFTEEAQGREMPMMFHLPTMTILAATLLDFGTEEQKRRHIPAILRGEELWVQFLSEPSGGSDLAASLTRATPDGESYVLTGSKIWSSSAYRSDYAMVVARTDWDAPKHRGLSVFIMKVDQPGVQVERIRQVNGSREFCQEFFDDVLVPAADLVGAANDGWTVATRLLYHEKLSVGGGSPLGVVLSGSFRESSDAGELLAGLARQAGRASDPATRQLVGRGVALSVVQRALIDRITRGIEEGSVAAPASAVLKLFDATTQIEVAELAAQVGREALVTGAGGGSAAAIRFLSRQAGSLAGGSNEIQRNIISERLLGMPWEWAGDRDVPFREVARGGRSPSETGRRSSPG